MPGIGNITPQDMADRAEAMGARVVAVGDKIKVFPPNGGGMIVLPTRMGNGTERANLIARLHREGLDVMTPPEKPRPTPLVIPAKKGPATVPTTDTETLLGLLGQAEQRITSLTSRVDLTVSRVEALELERDVLMRARDNLVKRVTELERAGGTAAPAPPSAIEVVRQLVLDFLSAHRGLKMTPETIKSNIIDSIPADAGATYVANACKDLALAGKIQGGGTNGRDGKAPSGHRGIYWMDPESA
jgi:hypothetical protein